jgi:hypothetical protein
LFRRRFGIALSNNIVVYVYKPLSDDLVEMVMVRERADRVVGLDLDEDARFLPFASYTSRRRRRLAADLRVVQRRIRMV